MISPTLCSKSSMLRTLSHSGLFTRFASCCSSFLELRAKNSSKLPRPKTRQTMPRRKRSSAPTAAVTILATSGWS
eukprot:22553-Pelagococcus_subviridis.AAC.1